MLNSLPTNESGCKLTLKYLDLLRKSQCTPTLSLPMSFFRDSAQPNNNPGCQKTLEEMEKVAKECLGIIARKK